MSHKKIGKTAAQVRRENQKRIEEIRKANAKPAEHPGSKKDQSK